ncbi:MAG: hypothetical protein ACI94Y_000778 [Maribacter sp.]|jgi:hypothetical protein
MKKYLKIIFINGLLLFIGCLFIELILGGWFSNSNKLNNLNLIRDKEYTYLVDVSTHSSIEINYSRDKYGLRGKSTFNTPEKIDILTIGGSTTDQRHVSDGQTWQDILENCLKKDKRDLLVSNAGVDGQSTFGHIKNFEAWFNNIPNLKPKYILLYVGINDFYRITENGKYDDLLGEHHLKSIIKTNSVFYNLWRTVQGVLRSNKYNLTHSRIDFSQLKYTSNSIGTKELYDLYEKNLEGFEKRLFMLKDYTESLGAKPVFITQPSMRYKWNQEGQLTGVSDTSFINGYSYNGVDYYNLLHQLNESIRKVANDESIVVELTTYPMWKEEDFYDFIHYTPKGSEKVGVEIYNQIKDNLE